MELKGASAKKYLNCSWLSQILLLPLWGSLIVFWHDALSICITGKDWAGIWREWPRSSLSSQPPWRCLWPSSSTSRMQPDPLEWQSYLAFRPVCLRTHPWLSDSLKDTRIWIRAVSGDSFHFINKTFIRAHTLAKTGHFLRITSTVKEYGHCKFKGR